MQDATDDRSTQQHVVSVSSGVGSAAAAAAVASLLSGAAAAAAAGSDAMGGGISGQLFQCIYCGSTFPHQSKLTRHILSHSLDSLKYRETTHYLHFAHELAGSAVGGAGSGGGSGGAAGSGMSGLAGGGSAGTPQPFSLDSLGSPDGPSAMEMEFAAAAAAAAAASMSGLGGGSGLHGLGGLGSSGGGNSMSPNSVMMGQGNDAGNVVLCKFCGKSFPDVSSLITHLPVHTGDRPFKCEFCGKAFKLRHHMKDHCRVHTGKCWTNYIFCDGGMNCGRRRRARANRVTNGIVCKCERTTNSLSPYFARYARPHETATHPNKPNNQKYADTFHLHVPQHTQKGERPFRCSMCGKTFSRSTILKAHEKTHYPKYVRKFLSPSPVETKDEPPN